MEAVSVDTSREGTFLVTLRGEIDFTNAAETHKAIRAALAGRQPGLVLVDVAEVTFLDSTGIGVLVDAMRAAGEVQAGFRVENPTPKVYDQLRMTGLLAAFGVAQR
ncbi:MAG TPA: STAS domain-containing protein [Nonomuraea sp.]|nr:STAS domain-containing protein [Nonomuraea sp.]